MDKKIDIESKKNQRVKWFFKVVKKEERIRKLGTLGSGMFNKDGSESKRKFRVYCFHEGCVRYLIGKWGGGGYGSISTSKGSFDSRNQVWFCNIHRKEGK